MNHIFSLFQIKSEGHKESRNKMFICMIRLVSLGQLYLNTKHSRHVLPFFNEFSLYLLKHLTNKSDLNSIVVCSLLTMVQLQSIKNMPWFWDMEYLMTFDLLSLSTLKVGHDLHKYSGKTFCS